MSVGFREAFFCKIGFWVGNLSYESVTQGKSAVVTYAVDG